MRLPAAWQMPAYYGGSTWSGYAWARLGRDGERLSLAAVAAARLTFRRATPTGDLGLELCLGRGLWIEGDRVWAQRGVLSLAAGSWHYELSVFWASTCTWEPWVRGRLEVIQHVIKGDCL